MTSPRVTATLPVFQVVVATALWGALFCVAKQLTQELTPFSATFARFFLAALPLLVLSSGEWKHLRRQDVPLLLAVGALSSIVFNAFMFFGLRLAPASDAVLAPATSPLFAALLGVFFFGDRLSGRQGLGLAVSLGGLALVFAGHFQAAGGAERLWGDALLLGSALAWSGYVRLSPLAARRYSPLVLTTVTAVVGAAASWPIVVAEGSWVRFASLSGAGWLQVGYISLLGSVVAFLLWSQGTSRLGPRMAATYMNLVPLWIMATAATFLGESLGWHQLVGIGVVLGGVWLSSRAAAPAPAALAEAPCELPVLGAAPSFEPSR